MGEGLNSDWGSNDKSANRGAGGNKITPINDGVNNYSKTYSAGMDEYMKMFAPQKLHKVYEPNSDNNYNTYDSQNNLVGSGGDFNTDFSWDGFKGNASALGDAMGSQAFATGTAVLGDIGMGILQYQKNEHDRKFKDKMFDLQEGQIAKQDALREGFQANMNG